MNFANLFAMPAPNRRNRHIGRIQPLLLLSISLMLWIGCEQRVAGGTDFPNEINGTVAKVDESPVAQAKVILFKQSSDDSRPTVHPTSTDFEPIDTVMTDEEGLFNFETQSGNYIIQASYDTNLVAIQDSIFFPEGDTNSINLEPMTLYFSGSLKGRIIVQDENTNPLEVNRVDLAGTPYSTSVDASGNFIFEDLPPGTYGLISFYQGDNSVSESALSLAGQVNPDSTLDIGTIVITTDHVLFEDFEFDDERAITGYLYGGGWWFGVGSGSYQSIPLRPGFPVSKSVIDFEGSKVFKSTWNFDEAKGGFYVVGFNIGYGADGYIEENAPARLSFFDFSNVDKVSFKAKGTGEIRLQLGTRAIRLSSVSEVGHFGYDLQLDDDFKEYQIDINQFKIGTLTDEESEILGDLTWEEARKEVYALSFVILGDAEIWLDDIRLIDYNINYFK